MDINEMTKWVGEWSRSKGWHEIPRTPLEIHMLCVSELAEATEEVRDGKRSFYEENGKPEGEMIEMADCVIRIMNYFYEQGWDLEEALNKKMKYNETRPHRHGGKTK